MAYKPVTIDLTATMARAIGLDPEKTPLCSISIKAGCDCVAVAVAEFPLTEEQMERLAEIMNRGMSEPLPEPDAIARLAEAIPTKEQEAKGDCWPASAILKRLLEPDCGTP